MATSGTVGALLAARGEGWAAQPAFEDWWPRWLALSGRAPFARAALGGFAADRLGWAFAAGYQAALRAMVPSLPDDRVACLAATEEKGGHPRHIHTRLEPAGEGGRLTGRKQWVTLGAEGGIFLVVASIGAGPDGRSRLVVARAETGAPGLRVEAAPPTPFVPEVPHGQLVLEGAPAVPLPGDGYLDYLKPFRTIEDLHVSGAALGYLLRVGLHWAWPRPLLAELLHLIAALEALAAGDPKDPALHLALEGLFQAQGRLLAAAEGAWEGVDPEVRERWRRDRALLSIAGRVRALRAEAAWRALGIAG